MPRNPILFLFPLLALALPALADVNGADPRLTNAPGESNCTSCHTGTALNAGGGSLTLSLPDGTTFTPGVTQRVTVTLADSAQRRWGFELSARLASDTTAQAGSLAAADSNAQVLCATGRTAPCTSATVLQFATHTSAGTRNGTTGGVTFSVDWTPPATDQGAVIFYATGNAANGNNANSGDHIYATTLTVSPAAAATRPAIAASSGVVNGASFAAGIGAGSWITIAGTNLSGTTRAWASADFTGNTLPTALDGVSVTVNGQAAAIAYISPTQINAVAPDDATAGPVEVRVTYNGAVSDPATVVLSALSPAFFSFDGTYLAATHADGSLAGKAGLFAAAPTLTTPAAPGETVILYGTGFGPTTPAVAANTLTTALAPLSGSYSVTIGGQPAAVSFAGLIPPYARLYQVNVVVPAGLASGDHEVIFSTGGVASPARLLTVAR